ncbi:hypothetical protein LINGRAHAP2_LOCUS5274 [Linum grandiflorum]
MRQQEFFMKYFVPLIRLRKLKRLLLRLLLLHETFKKRRKSMLHTTFFPWILTVNHATRGGQSCCCSTMEHPRLVLAFIF